ncbi:MAG: DUF1592 domain-containing protein, partial [Pirellulaceae bacterium]
MVPFSKNRLAWSCLFVMVSAGVGPAAAVAQGTEPRTFTGHVVPFLRTYCARCHGAEKSEGELSFERFRETPRIQEDYEVWQSVLQMLGDRQMPPADEPQPPPEVMREVVRVIETEMAKFDCNQEKRQPGRVTIRRLNRVEYNNTIRDLVGVDFQPANDFPSDDVGHGFDNLADVLSMPPILFEKYLAAAEKMVAAAWRDPVARVKLLPASGGGSDELSQASVRGHLASFTRRAFRRPATAEELDRLMAIVELAAAPTPGAEAGAEGREAGQNDVTPIEEAYATALTAVLTSPHFLFRIEADPPDDDPDGIRRLDDYELATRLSYFLWSTMPDEPLFELAARGELGTPEQLERQVQRMLADERSEALVQNFAGQWLQLRDLKNMTPDPERYPDFDESLRAAMQRETELFFATILRENRSILEFLNADYTYVNQRLARHYGIEDVQGSEFRRVPAHARRAGILTQASILLLTSNPTRTSPVKRGKWILENILGDPPPPPPAAVEELNEDNELLGNLRERMEQHREKESCAVCHRQMDTLGFGLENFDGIGAWRERDGRAEIDPSGTLPGGESF